MASLTRNRSGTDEGDSVPNADNIEHYRQRAAGGIGLILSGEDWVSLLAVKSTLLTLSVLAATFQRELWSTSKVPNGLTHRESGLKLT